MEQKHKMLLDQLEKDMHKEMMQQREELNREMDATMAEELEVEISHSTLTEQIGMHCTCISKNISYNCHHYYDS